MDKGQIESIVKRGLAFRDTHDPTFHFVKLSVHYPDEDARSHFESEMGKYFDFVKRNEDETEVVLKGYSKGSAMAFLLQYFNIPNQNCYAFGDSNNDEEMLLAAGNSILIGKRLRNHVDKVTFMSKDAQHDGVTYALQALNFIPKKKGKA